VSFYTNLENVFVDLNLLSFARNDDSDTDSDSDSDWSTSNLWSERGRESRQLRLIIWQHLSFIPGAATMCRRVGF